MERMNLLFYETPALVLTNVWMEEVIATSQDVAFVDGTITEESWTEDSSSGDITLM